MTLHVDLIHVVSMIRCQMYAATQSFRSNYTSHCTKRVCAPNRMNDRQTLRIPSWIRGFHVYKDWWTPTCGEILPLQPEPGNTEDKNAVAVLKESRVIGHIPYHLANTKDRTGIITHFISKPTNRGSVEVSGKAVNRGGGLGMEIPCVYNFDGQSKHVNLLQQLIDVGNNPAVRTEVDADSGKQRRPKRKKDSSNDGSKRKKK